MYAFRDFCNPHFIHLLFQSSVTRTLNSLEEFVTSLLYGGRVEGTSAQRDQCTHTDTPVTPIFIHLSFQSIATRTSFVQFVVFGKGIAGLMDEHSVIDGMGLQLSIKTNDAVTKP